MHDLAPQISQHQKLRSMNAAKAPVLAAMTNPTALIKLQALLSQIAATTYRLILVVGPVGAGKTSLLKALSHGTGLPYVNVNLVLSERLLDLMMRQRCLRSHRILAQILEDLPGDTACLDNIELLFEPSLRQDTLGCLHSLSRNRTLVVAWPGVWNGTTLTYARPGHPEYVHYDHPDALIVPDAT